MKIEEYIKQNEGVVLRPYLDTVGKLTVGVGRNLDDRGLSLDEVELMLKNDIKESQSELRDIFEEFDNLPDNVKMVLIDMMFNLNRLKLDHINFKDSNLSKLNDKKTWTVKTEHECNLGKWIDDKERKGEPFTKTQNWTHLKEVHKKVHGTVQGMIEDNCKDNSSSKIIADATQLDQAISDVFFTIQQVKIDNCKV